jgi:hypothetical protein
MTYQFTPAQEAAVLEKWPHLAPSQLATLAKRLANLGDDVAAATSPADAVYALTWSHVNKDASLIREAPTPQQVAEHQMQVAKAAGRDVGAADRMSFFRAAQEMDVDQRLAACPATSEELKAKDNAVKTSKLTPVAAASYDPADANSLVRAFCAAQESTYREMLREHGPGRLVAMARHWHEQSQRKPFTADTPAPVQARRNPSGKAAADAWAATQEARAMSAPARMSEYRRLLATLD